MSDHLWQNALAGPRSLGTAPDCAIAVIEDPGLIEIHAAALEDGTIADLERDLGLALPRSPWASASTGEILALWIGPDRWWILTSRQRAAELHGQVASSDLTGAHAALKLVGPAALEIMARVCALDFSSVAEGEARGTRISGIRVLVHREPGSVEQLLILVPRSRVETVALSLMKVARDAPRLVPFEPAPPPVV